jgi:hypothetical protein
MSRAKTATVRRMVYENLGITNQTSGYGSIKANERYPSAYVDDAIIGADFNVIKTLLKSKQYHFTDTFFEKRYIANNLPTILQPNIELLTVYFYKNGGETEERAVEIPWGMYEMFTENYQDSLFKFQDSLGTKYGGYYSVKDHLMYTIPFEGGSRLPQVEFTGVGPNFTPVEEIIILPDSLCTITPQDDGELPSPLQADTLYKITSDDASSFLIDTIAGQSIVLDNQEFDGTLYLNPVYSDVGYYKYISLSYPNSLGNDLKSPQSFEEAIAFLASANLLMKRADNPQQATYYLQQYQAMMGIYMTPSTNQSRVIDQ